MGLAYVLQLEGSCVQYLVLCNNYISASPTACLLRGYGRASTQNDRLGEAVILGTGTAIPAQWTCRRRCRYVVIAEDHAWQVCDNYQAMHGRMSFGNDDTREVFVSAIYE